MTIHPSALRPVTPRTVPGDPSASAFFVVAGCVVPGSSVEVEGIYQGPARLGYVSVLQRMGARGDRDVRRRTAPPPSGPPPGPAVRDWSATTVAAAEIPSLDEIPALAVAAAVAEGTTVFSDVGELRVKEVDRLRAVIDMVTAFGATAEAHGDTLSITGTGGAGRFTAPASTAWAITAWPWPPPWPRLAAAPGERSLITGFGATETSYPGFADDLAPPDRARARSAPRALIIAIDGPAGAGKSTISAAVALRLGLDRLDTGAMYRAVAALALARGIAPDDHDAVAALAAGSDIEVGARVVINGHDVTDVIRSPEVGQAVSVVAANADVRTQLVARQRAWAQAHGGGVVEGRDIGKVVFPEAEVKVYLTASPEERARRRHDESAADVARRDRIDSTRTASPLQQAPDAHLLDTTGRTAAGCSRGGAVMAMSPPEPQAVPAPGEAPGVRHRTHPQARLPHHARPLHHLAGPVVPPPGRSAGRTSPPPAR